MVWNEMPSITPLMSPLRRDAGKGGIDRGRVCHIAAQDQGRAVPRRLDQLCLAPADQRNAPARREKGPRRSPPDAQRALWAGWQAFQMAEPGAPEIRPLLLVADQLGRDTREVFAHTVFIGGAFGGNGGGATAVTRQAAVISQQLKRPAKVIWSREEDIAQDKQRPPV